MNSQEKDDKSATGFAGLSAMVSNLNEVLSAAGKEQSNQTKNVPPPTSQVIPDRQPQSAAPPRPVDTTAVTGSDIKLLLVVGAMVCVTWLIYEINDHTNRIDGPKSQPPARNSSPVNPSQQSPTSEHSTRPSEELPPIGTNHVLSLAQIRYCLAENIRLDAAQEVLQRITDSEVLRFNTMINDYNNRCGEYRYRRGTLESAKGEIERYRSLLELEGVSRFSERRASREEDIKNPSPPSTRKTTVPSVDRTPIPTIQPNKGEEDARTAGKTALDKNSNSPTSNTAGPSQMEKAKTNSLDGGREGTDAPSDAPSLSLIQTDRATNLQECLDGRYPALCNHSLLSESESEKVEIAERNANLKHCLTGQYPALCNHSLLTSTQVPQVEQAERKANLENCLDGRYPALCNYSLLTTEQAAHVREAEIRERRGH
ncbi:MAG: hypothetical protein H8J66_01410 [Nitrospira sp.]|nr:hypothetical protein [Nitrospira sp.]